MFTKYKNIPNQIIYTDKVRLKNGQTAWIFFIKEDYEITEYHVAFAISNKRTHIEKWICGDRNNLDNNITGKCGTEGLLWPKNKLIEFEGFDNIQKPFEIVVRGSDDRRKTFYKKALPKIGYKYDENMRWMYKEVNYD